MRKNFVFMVFLLVIQIGLHAQQLPLFSQYMFNTFLINPAAAGIDGYTAINLTAREQWLGLKDSPKTHSITAQTRLTQDNFLNKMLRSGNTTTTNPVSGRVGLGLNFFNDKNGLIDRTGFQFAYSYSIPLNQASLSMGLALSAYQFSVNKSKMVLTTNDDDLINNNDFNRFIPDFNFGSIYMTKDYYVGLSVSQLMQSSIQFGNDGNSSAYRLYRHYYLHGGYSYDIDGDYVIQSSALVKVAKSATPQMDISARVTFQNEYWGGLGFRTGSAFIILGGLTVDNFSFGYSFDYDLTSIQSHSFGSHELFVAIKFGNNPERFKWLHKF